MSGGQTGRRGHRRVVAPPTGPASSPERTEDRRSAERDPAAGEQTRRRIARAVPEDQLTPRERWLMQQRPPHWD